MPANRIETTYVEGPPCLTNKVLNRSPALLAKGPSVSFPGQCETTDQMNGVPFVVNAAPNGHGFSTRNQSPVTLSLVLVALSFPAAFLPATEFDFLDIDFKKIKKLYIYIYMDCFVMLG